MGEIYIEANPPAPIYNKSYTAGVAAYTNYYKTSKPRIGLRIQCVFAPSSTTHHVIIEARRYESTQKEVQSYIIGRVLNNQVYYQVDVILASGEAVSYSFGVDGTIYLFSITPIPIEQVRLNPLQIATQIYDSNAAIIDPAKEGGNLATIAAAVAAPATTPTVYNVTITTANTQYSQALPANTKSFSIKMQDNSAFRLAFVTDKVATPTAPYLTVAAGFAHAQDRVLAAALTLYFANAAGSKVAEIVAWA